MPPLPKGQGMSSCATTSLLALFVLLYLAIIWWFGGWEAAFTAVYTFVVIVACVPILCVWEYSTTGKLQGAPWLLFFAMPLALLLSLLSIVALLYMPIEVILLLVPMISTVLITLQMLP
eukprot:TRINITY_DN2709_c0_g1_i1.p1 TRINITY_DN2709_c0_g1~~TRINITY_DN2709_c0_g1_i1.p1  ORF type:complete len:119 (+),score=33.29 TRINITY_DN2709_c0_g1_i1:277-633(+)